jgi:glycosyltransferase involved in cell wall biosynthesis
MASLTLSVLIPAYNEERSIEDILLRAEKALDAINMPYEVIVIDDGSKDKTRFLAERHKVTVISNSVNYGKGYALRRGLKDARGDVVVTMDADGSHRPEEIRRLIEPLMNDESADAVIGSRFADNGRKDSTKKLHIVGNMMFNLLLRILTGRTITDSQTGFRAFKRSVLDEIQIRSDGYAVETELTVKTLRNGFKVREEPITFDKRNHGSSHVNPLRDGIRILRTIIQATVETRTHK